MNHTIEKRIKYTTTMNDVQKYSNEAFPLMRLAGR